MRTPGAPDLLIEARKALLDALDALQEHRQAVVLIGAQAIYLHTGRAHIALAEATKDSDLALDTRLLADEPLVEQAMRAAGFSQDLLDPQPGAWLNPAGIPVDLMVPEALAGGSGRRSVTIPPHDKRAARRAVGLEAAVVDHAPMEVPALALDDDRRYTVNVAGPAGLLVAKLHKLGERQDKNPGRLQGQGCARCVPPLRCGAYHRAHEGAEPPDRRALLRPGYRAGDRVPAAVVRCRS